MDAGPDAGRRPFRAILRDVIDSFERGYLEQVLAHHGHDLVAVMRSSGLSRRQLAALIRKHGLAGRAARPRSSPPTTSTR